MAASMHSEVDIFQAKEHACSRLGLNALKKQQSEALDAYLRGHDLFVCLPTGFGKSVIFQAAPMCWDFLNANNVPDDSSIPKSLAIVVVPLKSLAMNQLERCQAIGLEAATAIAEITDEVLECAGQGKYSVLFASPEALLSDKGTELLQLQSVYSRVCGLFVDESHCVTKWGQSAGKTAAFRKLYGNMGELRSRLQMDTPLIAMTATASSSVRKSVADSLSLRNVVLIHTSPILHNMKHIVLKTKSTQSKDMLGWLCSEIAKKGLNTDRLIIYCQSRKTCSELFSMFKCLVPADNHVYFNMFHTNTQPEVQEDILKSFSDPHGTVRVLFATIAFGLGVDIKGLHHVVMYGSPTDLDDYVQLSGRAGRDGKQSYSILVKYPSASGIPIKEEMKSFLNTDSCRRDVIHTAFPGVHQTAPCNKVHNCCDNCALTCSCEGDHCGRPPNFVEQSIKIGLYSGPKGSEVPMRFVPIAVQDQIRGELFHFQAQVKGASTAQQDDHIYAGPDIVCGLSSATINQIVSELTMAFTYTQFCQRWQFPNHEIAQHIWEICNKFSSQMPVEMHDILYNSSLSESESDNDEVSDEYREPVIVYSDSD